mgnify:CR=1 FL=1|tara:strand:+ start:723 stop:926 length:204 start_codon:yes stop_codon:yes gene_type:complete
MKIKTYHNNRYSNNDIQIVDIKTYKTDGDITIGVFIDDKFIEEAEVHSQQSAKFLRQYFKEKYCYQK